MLTINHELSLREESPASELPKHLLLTLGRIYMEAGLHPADALRSALADFDSYHDDCYQEQLPCVA